MKPWLIGVAAVVVLALAAAGVGLAVGATPARTSAPTLTPTPLIAAERPHETLVPTQPTPAATASLAPAESARLMANATCQTLATALDQDGNIISAAIWSSAVSNAAGMAHAAAAQDASWTGLADAVGTLAATPLPGDTASRAEKDAYATLFLPVAAACRPLGVELPTD